MQKFMQILATLALLLVLALVIPLTLVLLNVISMVEASEREVNEREKETES